MKFVVIISYDCLWSGIFKTQASALTTSELVAAYFVRFCRFANCANMSWDFRSGEWPNGIAKSDVIVTSSLQL